MGDVATGGGVLPLAPWTGGGVAPYRMGGCPLCGSATVKALGRSRESQPGKKSGFGHAGMAGEEASVARINLGYVVMCGGNYGLDDKCRSLWSKAMSWVPRRGYLTRVYGVCRWESAAQNNAVFTRGLVWFEPLSGLQAGFHLIDQMCGAATPLLSNPSTSARARSSLTPFPFLSDTMSR